jgi:curved DNA-binding protein CbpA
MVGPNRGFFFKMKDYYAILNVGKQAHTAEIKRSYRRLALQFHPDKNPETSAAHRFQEINEAYEVLGDPEQRSVYDARLENPFVEILQPQEPRATHRDPAYRRKRPPVPHKGERERMLELMAQYLPYTNKIVHAGFIISILFAVDFLLPAQTSADIIEKTYVVESRSRTNAQDWWLIETTKNFSAQVPIEFAQHFNEGDAVKISTSPILKIPYSVSDDIYNADIVKSIYGIFIFAPVALLLSALVGIVFRKKIAFAFNAGVVCTVIMVFILIIYLIL